MTQVKNKTSNPRALEENMQKHMDVDKLEKISDIKSITERIFNVTLEGIIITDHRGAILRANEAFEQMSGYTQEELIGKNPRIFRSGKQGKRFYTEMWRSIIENGYWEGEIWDRKKDNSLYPKHMSISALKNCDYEVEYYIAISIDISNLKEAEAKLYRIAYLDCLTMIPNRRLFYDRLGNRLAQSIKNSRKIAVLMIDMDEFKLINDSFGHSVGDVVLKEFAARIKSSIRKKDMVARIDGDQFAVILENIAGAEYVEENVTHIMNAIQMPYNIEGRKITIGVSVGIAISPDDGQEVEGLARKADAALNVAKKTGKGTYIFISDEIEKKNREVLEIRLRLKEAIERDEFSLYLQPKIANEEGKLCLVGAEALIRWKIAENQMCPPAKFIPIAENSGMIQKIGEWVFEEILRINEKLREHQIETKLAINVSARQLETDQFINKIKENPQVKEKNIILDLEITEGYLLRDFDHALTMLNKLHDIGIRIALDDFGTGFSSLSYLTRLPIEYLKIDKSFIDDVAVENNKNIVPYIIAMAKKLKMKTIAEGVETKEQADFLFSQNCDEIQGYYFGEPMDLEAFIQFAKEFEEKHNK